MSEEQKGWEPTIHDVRDMPAEEQKKILEEIYANRHNILGTSELKLEERAGRMTALDEVRYGEKGEGFVLLEETKSVLRDGFESGICNKKGKGWGVRIAFDGACAAGGILNFKEQEKHLHNLPNIIKKDKEFVEECLKDPVYKEIFKKGRSINNNPYRLSSKDKMLSKIGIKTKNMKNKERFDKFASSLYKLHSEASLYGIMDSVVKKGDFSDFDKLLEAAKERVKKDIEIDSRRFCRTQVQLEAYNMAVCNINEGRKDDLVEKMADRFDPQFRDTDVAKDDVGKRKEAENRYAARKILKDRGAFSDKLQTLRGLNKTAAKPVVKCEISKDMSRRFSQGGRQ